jgi:hypothetical protein
LSIEKFNQIFTCLNTDGLACHVVVDGVVAEVTLATPADRTPGSGMILRFPGDLRFGQVIRVDYARSRSPA